MRNKMRWELSLLVIGIMACSTTLNASNKKTATFKGTTDQVFSAAVVTAQANWQITVIDRTTRTLTFISHDRGTIGEGYSAAFEDSPDGVKVTVNWYNASGQGIAFGPSKVADKLFKGIEEQLSKQTKPPH